MTEDEGSAPAQPEGSLARKATRGFAVTGSSQLVRVALQTASVLILSRLLNPTDYGVVAMVTAVLGIAELLRDMGLSTAAIQAKDLSIEQRDNLWWINTAVGFGLMIVTMAAAPLIAWGYREPATLAVTLAMAPGYLLGGMSTQYRANLVRDLRFNGVAVTDLANQVTALAFGISLAALGFGYWALVGQTLFASVFGLVSAALLGRWVPGRFRRGVGTKKFVTSGMSYLVSSLLFYVSVNADAVIVGKLFGPNPLGIYNRSVQLVRIPFKMISGATNGVLVPIMSKVQDEDEKILRAMRVLQIALSYPVLFVVLVLSTVPADAITLALGAKWVSGSAVMAWVSVGSGLSVMSSGVSTALVAKGLARPLAWSSAFTTVTTIGAILVGSQWGITGIAAALAILTFATWPISFIILNKFGNLNAYGVMRSGARIVLAGLIGWLTVSALIPFIPLDQHLLRVLAALVTAALFMSALSLFPAFRRDYVDLLRTAKSLRG